MRTAHLNLNIIIPSFFGLVGAIAAPYLAMNRSATSRTINSLDSQLERQSKQIADLNQQVEDLRNEINILIDKHNKALILLEKNNIDTGEIQ